MAIHVRKSIWWERTFDPDADYVVIRPFLIEGEPMKVDEFFDKTTVTRRTLRQLFNVGLIMPIDNEQKRIEKFQQLVS